MKKILRLVARQGMYIFIFFGVGALMQVLGVPAGAATPLMFLAAISYFLGRHWLRRREKRQHEDGETVRGSGLGDAGKLAKQLQEID